VRIIIDINDEGHMIHRASHHRSTEQGRSECMYTSPTSLLIHPIRHTTHNSNSSCRRAGSHFTV